MFGSFFMKNGPGSPGHTAKKIIEAYNLKNHQRMASEPSEIYLSILLDRATVAQQLSGQSIYHRLVNWEEIKNFIQDDISTFTFLILFSESQNFRNSVMEFHLESVTKAIYEVCRDRSGLCRLSLNEFREKAVEISNYRLYKI